ncbi:hypothetical protein LXL04_013502 [Taraxacum kok-saghyz]
MLDGVTCEYTLVRRFSCEFPALRQALVAGSSSARTSACWSTYPYVASPRTSGQRLRQQWVRRGDILIPRRRIGSVDVGLSLLLRLQGSEDELWRVVAMRRRLE